MVTPERMPHILGEDQLKELSVLISQNIVTSRQERSSWNRRIDLVIGAIAIVSIIFSAGINWSRITTAEARVNDITARQDKFDTDLRSLRDNLADERGLILVINEKLDTLSRNVAEIRAQTRRGDR